VVREALKTWIKILVEKFLKSDIETRMGENGFDRELKMGGKGNFSRYGSVGYAIRRRVPHKLY
jgi:hypothetical protein